MKDHDCVVQPFGKALQMSIIYSSATTASMLLTGFKY